MAIVAAALSATPVVRPYAATTELLVVDRYSGLALNGFDPVAYFVDKAAAMGSETLEYPFAGAVWRFRNEGNRAAFMADPEVYMPRFGGYDPVAVARGVPIPGDPRLWLIVDDRLYLFFTPGARDGFADDAERIAAAADRRWPEVRLTLSP
jgi:hypothetical protein